MRAFDQMIDELEMAVETALQFEDRGKSYRAALIFERLEGVQNAIDDWRQG